MNRDKQIEEMAKLLGDTWIVDLEGTPHDLSEVLMRCDIEIIAEQIYDAGYRKQSEWISVDERLPEDGQIVLIYDGGAYQWKPAVNSAIFEKGKTAAQLKEEGYRIISGADEHGNNMKPYRWCAVSGPMDWFGQMVTHWMPLPEAPKMKGE